MVKIKISNRAAKRIRQGHLWVYRSDVRDAKEAERGAIVNAVDEAGNFVGQAFYSSASEIALRFLTTGKEKLDRDWWRNRILACAQRRALIAEETNAYRLIFSEGDLLPAIIVDVYDGHYVLQTLSQGSDRLQHELVTLLIEEFRPKSIIELNDARVRQLEELELRSGTIYGDTTAEIEVVQHGIRFLVNPQTGQKTGAFLDQRENYAAAKRLAHGNVLDCFTFNGGFALHIADNCDKVLGIDISSDAVTAAQRNARLNNAANVQFKTANVFDALREMEAAGDRFETIILDPPAFTKSRATIKSGARGYKEINLRALKLLRPGGVLITCTCSYHMSEDMFLEIIADASIDARRRLQIIERRGQSSDHPVLLGVPETHYLKCVIARVIE
ncbi:MAG TPA: class I SAM-dependent rRNA methyltransferase [Pyrinomonadaceae bacterium]|jgi:23S rRNA (cytosine1962-C5)-methyltransferase|nr:class I SAM-dependent rRNA methyltransferase [Pyrinomonadaceae bacterium]